MRRTCLVLAILAACSNGTGRPTGDPIPIPHTLRTIVGEITYFTTGPTIQREPDGRLTPDKGFRNSTIPALAARIPVEILAPDGTKLGETVVDANGKYSIQVDFGVGAAATRVRVRVTASIEVPGTTVRVCPDRNSPPYTLTSPSRGEPTSGTMRVDLAIRLDDGAAAYHMCKILYDGMTLARAGTIGTMPDLDVYWEEGNGDQSFFVKGPNGGELTIAGGIPGDNTSNQDAWDGPRVARLLGEYMIAYFWNAVAPEGTPNDALLVPSAAWREGFLDFWSCIARDDDEYWETVGSGSEGRITRFFNIESFFDPALPSLGPDDPNVYQNPSVVGIGSRFTIAEVLWDVHDMDFPTTGDNDGSNGFPAFVTLRLLQQARPGFSYPYFTTLLDAYVNDSSMVQNQIILALTFPEDQGIVYTHPGVAWPPQVSPDGFPGQPIAPPFDKTVTDEVDTLNPVPVNLEIGEETQRYFMVDMVQPGDLTVTLTTTGNLIVEILDQQNNVLVSGPSPQTATNLPEQRYIIRVRPAPGAAPQESPFDLRIELD